MPNDLERLQGVWQVAAMAMDGAAAAPETLEEARIEIRGERFTSSGMGAVYEGTVELDPSASPASVDLKFDAGPEKGNINRGIYRMEGDSWTLCLATRGGTRPKRFGSRAGSGTVLETLVRGQAAKARQAKRQAAAGGPRGPATEFEGEWRLVSMVTDGKPLEELLVQWVKRITRGNQTTVMAGPQTMLKVEFNCDPSQSPAAIDYRNLAGPKKGTSQLGIYQVAGGVATFCMAPPGGARPAEFVSVRGDGRTLTAWKRA